MATRLALFLGIALLIGAGAVVAADIVDAIPPHQARPTALGNLLFALNREALVFVQIAVQGHVSAALWDSVFAPILRLPAALIIGLPGLVLMAVGFRLGRARHGKGKAGA
jgi:hypothetical protein